MSKQHDREKEAFSLLTSAGFNEFPKRWTATYVEDLLSEDRGISVGIMYPGEHDPFGIPIIKAGDLNSNRINPHLDFKVSLKKHQEYLRTELEGGEIVMTLVGEIGLCSVVPKSMKGWNTARAVAVIRLKEPEEAKFLRLCFLSKPIKHLMDVWANTTVQPTINLKDIKKLPIPLPSKNERDAIVKIIDCIDDKIELNRRMNETLESIARATFTSWFINFDPVRAKADGRQPEGMDAATAALFPSEFETVEGQEIPKGWQIKPFTEIIEIIGGGTPKTSNPDYWNGHIPWFSVVDSPSINDVWAIDTEKKITDDGLNNSSTRLLTIGTTIITARGTVGNLALVGNPMTMNQSCYGLKPKTDIGPYFSYYKIRSLIDELKQNTHGSVFDTITRDTFSHFSIIIPSKKICSKYEEISNLILGKIKQNLIESKNLSSLRDTLLPKLLSGELPITNPEQFTGVS